MRINQFKIHVLKWHYKESNDTHNLGLWSLFSCVLRIEVLNLSWNPPNLSITKVLLASVNLYFVFVFCFLFVSLLNCPLSRRLEELVHRVSEFWKLKINVVSIEHYFSLFMHNSRKQPFLGISSNVKQGDKYSNHYCLDNNKLVTWHPVYSGR